MKILTNAEVITRSEKLGMGTDIWYRLDYFDTGTNKEHTAIEYGKNYLEACKKAGIEERITKKGAKNALKK